MTGTVRASSRRLGALAVLAGLLAGCATVPVPIAAERIDPPSAGVQAISFLRVDASGTWTPAVPHNVSADEAAALAVLTDLRTFAAGLPDSPGPAVLTGGYAAADGDLPRWTEPVSCVRRPADLLGTALYCPDQDAIVADSAALVPVLRGHYGDGALAAALAHEFGHAVQARTGPTPQDRAADPDRYPPLLVELQADCFAGAFLSWAAAGSAPHVRLPPESLVRAVAPLLDFRDAPGSDPDAATAHGSATDRFRALDTGVGLGAGACPRMTVDGVAATTTLGLPAGVPGDVTDSMAQVVDAAGVAPAPAGPAGPTAADLAGTDTLGPLARDAAVALALADAATGDDARRASCLVGAWVGEPARRGSADQALDYLRSRVDATYTGLRAFSTGVDGGAAACR